MVVVSDYDVIANANTTSVHVVGEREVTRESWLDNRKYLCLRNVSEWVDCSCHLYKDIHIWKKEQGTLRYREQKEERMKGEELRIK
jgi:hypothetical protein